MRHIIHTIDGDTYYIPSKALDQFLSDMNCNKFIRIGDAIIAVHQIKKVLPYETLLEKVQQEYETKRLSNPVQHDHSTN